MTLCRRAKKLRVRSDVQFRKSETRELGRHDRWNSEVQRLRRLSVWLRDQPHEFKLWFYANLVTKHPGYNMQIEW